MVKVSVIIPVYNSQRYIARCLNSILNQTLLDFEVICVDDGSSDDSYSILSRYSVQHENIIVIKQSNMGQGLARNKGVSMATGEYIKFVDADDYLHPDCLQILYQSAKKTTADIVVCKAFCTNDTEDMISPLLMWNNAIGNYSRDEFINMDFFNNLCSPVLWDKLIKSDIAKTCLSPSLKRGQDFVTLIKYCSLCKNIYFVSNRLYYYRHHSSSVMATPESRETIMLDFSTEKMAINVMQRYFKDTLAYRLYCKRIRREWAKRIGSNKKLLSNNDITMIYSFINGFLVSDNK